MISDFPDSDLILMVVTGGDIDAICAQLAIRGRNKQVLRAARQLHANLPVSGQKEVGNLRPLLRCRHFTIAFFADVMIGVFQLSRELKIDNDSSNHEKLQSIELVLKSQTPGDLQRARCELFGIIKQEFE